MASYTIMDFGTVIIVCLTIAAPDVFDDDDDDDGRCAPPRVQGPRRALPARRGFLTPALLLPLRFQCSYDNSKPSIMLLYTSSIVSCFMISPLVGSPEAENDGMIWDEAAGVGYHKGRPEGRAT